MAAGRAAIYSHLHFILSFWICHKCTCRWVVPAPPPPQHVLFGRSVIAASTQGRLEWLRETKDINSGSTYWWLPLETCVPYATLPHLINHSYSWLTTPSFFFVLSRLMSFLLSHSGHKVPSSGRISVVPSLFFFFPACPSLSFLSPQCEDVRAAAGIFNEGSFG